MARFFESITDYHYMKLVDTIEREAFEEERSHPQIICDIDKTYLETEFESVFKMLKIVFESAEDKITVKGASTLLEAVRWGDHKLERIEQSYPRGLHFVSSSPKQLRAVLEKKLSLDGLDWSSDTFKNQNYNVMKGRVDQLKKHVAYKSAAILNLCYRFEENTPIYCIGDNAETDAFIYLGAFLFLSHKLTPSEYSQFLQIAGVDKKVAIAIAKAYKNPPKSFIRGIFIRNAPGYEFSHHETLTKPVRLFVDYYHLSLMFVLNGLLLPEKLPELSRKFHNQHLFSQNLLKGHLLTFLDQSLGDDIKKVVEESLVFFKNVDARKFPSQWYLPAQFNCFDDLNGQDIIEMALDWFSKHRS